MREPIAVKVARWVLWGGGGRNAVSLPALVALCVRVSDRKCCDLLYDQQLPIQTCVTGNSQV